MKVLIVEDNVKMRACIKKMLAQNLQHLEAINECRSSGEAVEIYSQYQPDWG